MPSGCLSQNWNAVQVVAHEGPPFVERLLSSALTFLAERLLSSVLTFLAERLLSSGWLGLASRSSPFLRNGSCRLAS
jgi:hypothetical protein